jgi:Uma2 family endonuclease
MAVLTKPATIHDLERHPGKAELINGRIVELMPTGRRPNRVAGLIFIALNDYATKTQLGEAYTDNIGFRVPELCSGRESFSPDASFFIGPFSQNDMQFIDGAPTLAVEVRSEGDHGKKAEREIVAKRSDYFEAGTLVVWDVDIEQKCIRVYRSDQPDKPVVYGLNEEAESEPALPGWRVPVKSILG